MRPVINYFAAIVLAAACSAGVGCAQGVGDEPSDLGTGGDEPAAEAPIDTAACTLDETRVGEVGASLDLGAKAVTIDAWTEKASEPGVYVGFTLHTSTGEAVAYTVKAGNKLFSADTPSWTNPNGSDGPNVKGIARISFCADAP